MLIITWVADVVKFYLLSMWRVITHQEIRERREEEDRRRESESQLAELLERGKELQIKKNLFYEYKVGGYILFLQMNWGEIRLQLLWRV